VKKDFLIYALPMEEDKQRLSDHFGDAPYFYLFQMSTHGHVIQEEKILSNPHLKEEKGKGIKVSEWLLQNGVDTVYTRKTFDGKGPSYVFSNADVEVIITEDKTIDEIHQKLTEPEIN
jgi:predicted Fe-Mo cluster-binding NifX family protein